MKRNTQKEDDIKKHPESLENKSKKRGSNLTDEERQTLFEEQKNHWLNAGRSMKDDDNIITP